MGPASMLQNFAWYLCSVLCESRSTKLLWLSTSDLKLRYRACCQLLAKNPPPDPEDDASGHGGGFGVNGTARRKVNLVSSDTLRLPGTFSFLKGNGHLEYDRRGSGYYSDYVIP